MKRREEIFDTKEHLLESFSVRRFIGEFNQNNKSIERELTDKIEGTFLKRVEIGNFPFKHRFKIFEKSYDMVKFS